MTGLMKVNGLRRKLSRSISRYHGDIRMEGLRKSMKRVKITCGLI